MNLGEVASSNIKSLTRNKSRIATWIGQITALANHFPLLEHLRTEKSKFIRDSEGLKIQGRLRKRTAEAAKCPTTEAKRPKIGDLSSCPRWEAVHQRILAKQARISSALNPPDMGG